jgi:hypothetical protein
MISPSRPRSRQVTLAVSRKRLETNTAVAQSPARTTSFGDGFGKGSSARRGSEAGRHDPTRARAF